MVGGRAQKSPRIQMIRLYLTLKQKLIIHVPIGQIIIFDQRIHFPKNKDFPASATNIGGKKGRVSGRENKLTRFNKNR